MDVKPPREHAVSLLPFCPMCRYDLTGLAGDRQCPECGLPYDSNSKMWIDDKPWSPPKTFAMGVQAVALIVFGALAVAAWRSAAAVWSQPAGMFLIMPLVLAGGMAFNYLMNRRLRYTAIVVQGVVKYEGLGSAVLIDWSQIRTALPGLFSAVSLHLDPRWSISLPRRTWSADERDELLKAVRARLPQKGKD